mmetsp:Transcript_11192/g.69083  ORF Transcript_11192/g.69083 Transcript_11192/m.69083 type:complete len:100 (+) Transcript_11192:307-606(+)
MGWLTGRTADSKHENRTSWHRNERRWTQNEKPNVGCIHATMHDVTLPCTFGWNDAHVCNGNRRDDAVMATHGPESLHPTNTMKTTSWKMDRVTKVYLQK